MTYTVESYDAFDAPSERKHLKHGEFQHGAAALVAAQALIDKHLLGSLGAGKTAAEAIDQWRHFGEVPMIFGDPRIAFDPFAYAELRAAELARTEAATESVATDRTEVAAAAQAIAEPRAESHEEWIRRVNAMPTNSDEQLREIVRATRHLTKEASLEDFATAAVASMILGMRHKTADDADLRARIERIAKEEGGTI